jgi:hypothetical protein
MRRNKRTIPLIGEMRTPKKGDRVLADIYSHCYDIGGWQTTFLIPGEQLYTITRVNNKDLFVISNKNVRDWIVWLEDSTWFAEHQLWILYVR